MKRKTKIIRAWHFANGDTLRDGRPLPADGEWLEHDGELEPCRSGLHASRDILDALRYAPGTTFCLVECSGEVIESDDKLVCSRRRIVARADVREMLVAFARWCADRAAAAAATAANRVAADAAAGRAAERKAQSEYLTQAARKTLKED